MNSKAKGSEFERKISKQLSKWLTNGERDDTIWRSRSSGAYATNRMKKGIKSKGNAGDLTSTSEESKRFLELFTIECKNYKKLDLYNLIEKKGQIIDWWDKLKKETAEQDGKFSLLIFKESRKPIMCLSQQYFFESLYNFDYPESSLRLDYNNQDLILLPLEDIINSDYDRLQYSLSVNW